MRILALVAAMALTVTACGGDGSPEQADGGGAGAGLNALVASYDLVAGRPQRFLVGVVDNRQRGLAYGEVELEFAYTGTRDEPLGSPRPGPAAKASFLPIPGQEAGSDSGEARLVSPAEVIGVYGAPEVAFDRPGFWQVRTTAAVDGDEMEAEATFEVLASSPLPAVGDPAPRSRHPLAGDPAVPARAVDSRAEPVRGAPVPDPELHSTTVADALAAGRPAMVVVSTPTYCVSRFCGPITESVGSLAQRFGERMAFVHLEVWRDFETKEVNPAAAEWICPGGAADCNEPWVFVIDGKGTIVERLDNVATDAELERAAQRVLG